MIILIANLLKQHNYTHCKVTQTTHQTMSVKVKKLYTV